MLSYNSESIPPKEDTCAVEKTEQITTTTTNSTTTATTISNDMANAQASRFQFGQKAKMFRDMFTQHKLKLDGDQTQLFVIIVMSVLAVLASLSALATNNWTCDGEQSFGLWNTCRKTAPVENETTTLVVNLNTTTFNGTGQAVFTAVPGTVCAKQTLFDVKVEYAEQSRIDQVTAAQGLIVCGTILYILSVVALSLGYKFIKVKNLNSVRNALVTSMFVQIISFFLQLIGFFLYILTDRLSISVGLLFIYFGLAMFATNIINFITIEYKSYKIRQISI